ncbi:hypothetical protein AB0M19_10680 [Streptomyces sp. NPDC051920]|uniref:hypothetical protein n=1 Tax=Streptomyces sp. NPDC051920 TaxID=3155523 RepID=UPI00343E8445
MIARPPSPRTVSNWILSRPETLTEPEQLELKTVRTHCPELDALTQHVRSFAVMFTQRQGGHPPAWLYAVRQDDLPSLHTLAVGMTATATRSPPDSPCPGAPARSRQMSGRAGSALLRKRVLLGQ